MKHISVKLGTMIVVAVLTACSQQPIGYGVVLWPEADSGLSEAEVLPIVAESEIQETVTVETGDSTVDTDTWRILPFETEDAARQYAEELREWATLYGRSLRTALPVRERADRTTTRVYRLRDGEIVKVLDRQDEPSDEAGLVDYWYRVLTQEGITGWVFGYHLELTGASGRVSERASQQDAAEQLAADIATVSWRPEYYDEMIRTGQIVLARFGPRFGLFLDPEAQEVRLVLPDLQRTVAYTEMVRPSDDVLQFPGTSLTLTLSGERSIDASFDVSGRPRTVTFVRIEEDLAEIIEAEQERRQRRLEQILDRGNGLVSTAFGTIALGDQGSISWTGYDRLVPSVLPASFDGTASLDFSLFLADDLQGRYDGALRMRLGAGASSAFLYALVEDGLRLVYVPDRLVSDTNVVEEEPISPVVMFYRFVSQ